MRSLNLALVHSKEYPAKETKNIIRELGHRLIMEHTSISDSIKTITHIPGHQHPDLVIVDIDTQKTIEDFLLHVHKLNLKREFACKIVLIFDEDHYENFEKIGCMFFGTYIVRPFTKKRVQIKLDAAQKRMEIYKRGFKAEELLYHHSHMSLIGRLSAGLAHELNNDLYIIRSNVQLLNEYINYLCNELNQNFNFDDKNNIIINELPAIIKRMQRGVEKIERITHGLNSFGMIRKNTDKTQKINIDFLLDYTLDICNHIMKYHIKVIRENQLRNPFIKGNFEDLLRVFSYLFIHITDWCKKDVENQYVTLKIKTHYHTEKPDYICVTLSHKTSSLSLYKLETLWDPIETESPGFIIISDILIWNNGNITVEEKNGEPMYKLELPIAK